MALVVEDGTKISGSNSYVSRADYIAYASSIGVTVTDDETADQQLIKAAEYIDYFEQNLMGYRVERDQSMSFPRIGLMIDGWTWNSDEIPEIVKDAQMQFALDVKNGDDLYNRPNNPNQLVKRERVEGAIEIEYAVVNGSSNTDKLSKGDSLLRRLFKPTTYYQAVKA